MRKHGMGAVSNMSSGRHLSFRRSLYDDDLNTALADCTKQILNLSWNFDFISGGKGGKTNRTVE